MLTTCDSAALLGLDAIRVDVEVDAKDSSKGSLVIVGLPDMAIKESKDRILSAITHSGFKFDGLSGTINLAPADLKKVGTFYDLPIALSLLTCLGHLSPERLENYIIAGELGLGGEVRPILGALSLALLAKKLGKTGLLLPVANAPEAAVVKGVEVYGLTSLREGALFLAGKTPLTKATLNKVESPSFSGIDFADIKGQANVKRAMEISAAGGHNILISGPPGSGKTMIAKALPGILPPLTLDEGIEVTKIRSVAGLQKGGAILSLERPFRSPHHTISYAGMVGGGTNPRPGEVSLAHHGVLFLDEFPEFSRLTLEVLRQPLEDGVVTISRASGSFTYPTTILLVAAMNPCPCGYYGHPKKPCRDSQPQIDRYKKRISGPLLDRIDLHVFSSPIEYKDLKRDETEEASSRIRERVVEARKLQRDRLGRSRTNSCMTPKEVRRDTPYDHEIFKEAIDVMGLSARFCTRILKVGRTIADLEGSVNVLEHHLMEALSYRPQ